MGVGVGVERMMTYGSERRQGGVEELKYPHSYWNPESLISRQSRHDVLGRTNSLILRRL